MVDRYSPEFKDFFDKFENLTPWDKEELGLTLFESLNEDSQESILEELGYENSDKINFLKEVKYNYSLSEIINEYSDSDVYEYILECGLVNEFLEYLEGYEIAEGIFQPNHENYTKNKLKSFISQMKKLAPEILEKVLKEIYLK